MPDQNDLQPHQRRVIQKMMEPGRKGLVVVHGMGSGKTRTAIETHKALGGDADVIVPAALQDNYSKELKKWGGDPEATKIQSQQRVVNGAAPLKSKLMIVDEGHRARNPKTKLSDAIKDSPAEKRMILSGTPVYNNASDIATLVNQAAGKDVMREGKAFDTRYLRPNFIRRMQGDKLSNRAELKKHLGAYVDHHKGDPSMLPKVTSRTIPVDMGKRQSELYRAAMGTIPSGMKLQKQDIERLRPYLTGVRQVSNTSKALDSASNEEPKLDRAFTDLQKHLEDPKGKALVYSNWLDHGIRPMQKRLIDSKIPHGVFTGDEPLKQRDQTVRDYNSGKHRALIVSSSGAEGLDLKGTRMVQVLEPHFNNAKIRQVVGRSARMGSHSHLPPEERNVDVRQYVARPQNKFLKGTSKGVDDLLAESAADKDEIARQITALFSVKRKLIMLNSKRRLIQFEFPEEYTTQARIKRTTKSLDGSIWNTNPMMTNYRNAVIAPSLPVSVKNAKANSKPYQVPPRDVTETEDPKTAQARRNGAESRRKVRKEANTTGSRVLINEGGGTQRGMGTRGSKPVPWHQDKGDGTFPADWRNTEALRDAEKARFWQEKGREPLESFAGINRSQPEAIKAMAPIRSKIARDLDLTRRIFRSADKMDPEFKIRNDELTGADHGKAGEFRSNERYTSGKYLGPKTSEILTDVRKNLPGHVQVTRARYENAGTKMRDGLRQKLMAHADADYIKANPSASGLPHSMHNKRNYDISKLIEGFTGGGQNEQSVNTVSEKLGWKPEHAKKAQALFARYDSHNTPAGVKEIENRVIGNGVAFRDVPNAPLVKPRISYGKNSRPLLKIAGVTAGVAAAGYGAYKANQYRKNKAKEEPQELSSRLRVLRFGLMPVKAKAELTDLAHRLINKRGALAREARVLKDAIDADGNKLVGSILPHGEAMNKPGIGTATVVDPPRSGIIQVKPAQVAPAPRKEMPISEATQRKILDATQREHEKKIIANAIASGHVATTSDLERVKRELESQESAHSALRTRFNASSLGHSEELNKMKSGFDAERKAMEHSAQGLRTKASDDLYDAKVKSDGRHQQATRTHSEAVSALKKKGDSTARKNLLIGIGSGGAIGVGGTYAATRQRKEMEFAVVKKEDKPSAMHDIATGGIEGGIGILATDPILKYAQGEGFHNPFKGITQDAGLGKFSKKVAIGAGVGAVMTGAIGYGLHRVNAKRERSGELPIGAKTFSRKGKLIRFEATASRSAVARDRYVKDIYEKDDVREDGQYEKAAAAGGALGVIMRKKMKMGVRKSLVTGIGAGLAAQGLARAASYQTKDQFGDRSHTGKRIDNTPAQIAALTGAGILIKRHMFAAKVREIRFARDWSTKWVGGESADGTQIKVNSSRRAAELYQGIGRTKGLIKDIRGAARGDVAVDDRGRARKREWEKPWMHKAALGVAIAATTGAGYGLLKVAKNGSPVARKLMSQYKNGELREALRAKVPGVKKVQDAVSWVKGETRTEAGHLISGGEGVMGRVSNWIGEASGRKGGVKPYTWTDKEGNTITTKPGSKLHAEKHYEKYPEDKSAGNDLAKNEAEAQRVLREAGLNKFAAKVRVIKFDENTVYKDQWHHWLRRRPNAKLRDKRDELGLLETKAAQKHLGMAGMALTGLAGLAVGGAVGRMGGKASALNAVKREAEAAAKMAGRAEAPAAQSILEKMNASKAALKAEAEARAAHVSEGVSASKIDENSTLRLLKKSA